MRKSPATQKTTGSVLVPLFLEQAEGETIETAVARAQFDEVWVVFQALQEHDEVLAEIIRHMREERGRTKGTTTKPFEAELRCLGRAKSLDVRLPHPLRRRSSIRIGSSWDERYGELAASAEYGDCNVLQNGSRTLCWPIANNQRGKAGRLGQDRQPRLEALGL